MFSLPSSGFVDLQVNGYGGVNFSSSELTMDEIERTMDALAARGTLAFCPTLITSSLVVYRHALPLLARAMASSEGSLRMPGIHLEGPFISPEEGAVGAHPTEHVRRPSLELFDELYRLADGRVSLLTLAPEQPGALELIRRAVSLGVLVSIGHTLADEHAVRAAVDAGASLSTHLGNGCPNLIHRHHNPIWPQLAELRLTAMLITDGHHLPPPVIASFLAAKGSGKVMVTSDAAPPAGCPPGDYSIFGTRVRLEPSGRLRNLERDTLAGSSATMFECMSHLASLNLLSEDELWQVGRDHALALLGRSLADLPDGSPVVYSEGRFQLQTTA
jgi:N-acetylglucosamine-6-phosphate deacetylase